MFYHSHNKYPIFIVTSYTMQRSCKYTIVNKQKKKIKIYCALFKSYQQFNQLLLFVTHTFDLGAPRSYDFLFLFFYTNCVHKTTRFLVLNETCTLIHSN